MSTALANLPILGLLALASILVWAAPDAYHRGTQEDGALEWLTFWSFLGAAAVHGATVLAASRRGPGARSRPPAPQAEAVGEGAIALALRSWPWFRAGLGIFCAWVALEEISWGQRILGYRPPEYFLAENFQQEFNVHNTISDDLRQLGFLGVCLGYGVILPLCRIMPGIARRFDATGIVAPPLALIPAFATTAVLYELYPWEHTGEWSEAMLGTAMLFAAILNSHGAEGAGRASGGVPDGPDGSGPGRRLLGAWVGTLLLGLGTPLLAGLASALTGGDAVRIEQARVELEALRRDMAAARTKTRCGLHKRIYTMVEAYRLDHLHAGEFAMLSARPDQPLPEDRARYFLDPWNSPYWIQHICSDDRRRRAIFVYSMGPNRRRDSSDWDIVEDDLGAWISRPRPTRGD